MTRFAQPPRLGLTATAAFSATLIAVSILSAPTALAANTPQPSAPTYSAGRYIVTLQDAAAANYLGDTKGLDPVRAEGETLDVTTPEVTTYTKALTKKQAAVSDAVGADIITQYSLVANAFVAQLTADQARQLASRDDVLSVTADGFSTMEAAPTSATDYLNISTPGGLWETGAQGEGTVVAVLDSGIAPDNPLFSGAPLTTTKTTDAPYLDGDAVVFNKSDGTTFRGACQTGTQFKPADCNDKLIGARYFNEGFGDENTLDKTIEYLSPRDGQGHGTHVAGIAVGNANTPARGITISGVAPKAKLAVYKVCWTGLEQTGCRDTDIISGIEAAVQDNVDVINASLSNSGSSADLVNEAFRAATTAGIFVATSAGNSGDAPSTLEHLAPWITSVAATITPGYEATLKVTSPTGTDIDVAGESFAIAQGRTASGNLVRATDVAAENKDAQYCELGTVDKTAARGKIVLCQYKYGTGDDQVTELLAAGAAGIILVSKNNDDLNIAPDQYPVLLVASKQQPRAPPTPLSPRASPKASHH
jgi:subtilisin family serine protease